MIEYEEPQTQEHGELEEGVEVNEQHDELAQLVEEARRHHTSQAIVGRLSLVDTASTLHRANPQVTPRGKGAIHRAGLWEHPPVPLPDLCNALGSAQTSTSFRQLSTGQQEHNVDLSVEWERVQRGALQTGQTAHGARALQPDSNSSSRIWA